MLVEVATFRREPERADDAEELLITDDNTFRFAAAGRAGAATSPSRALLQHRRLLGDRLRRRPRRSGSEAGSRDRRSDVRFREDPVRMMRAIEFASRLDFEIEPATYDAILRHKNEILKASAPRVSRDPRTLPARLSRGAIHLNGGTGLLDPLVPEVYKRSPATVRRTSGNAGSARPDSPGGPQISDPVLLSVLFLPGFSRIWRRRKRGADQS